MKPARFLNFLSRSHPGRRMLGSATLLAFLACGVMPASGAAKPHMQRITGTYLTGDGHLLEALAKHDSGTYWIDGYRMAVSKQTQICWHRAPLDFLPRLNKEGQPVARLTTSSPCEAALLGGVGTTAWLQYRGTQKKLPWFEPEIKATAARIDIWRYNPSENRSAESSASSVQAWRTLCASSGPHELHYPNENSIEVVCDAKVYDFIQNLFASLLRRPEANSGSESTIADMPRFYVVKPFQVRHNFDFETIDGYLGAQEVATGSYPFYYNPRARSSVHEIVFAPDGTALIADTGLANLRDEAQCAALLSYSLTMESQHSIQHLFAVQRAKFNLWNWNNKTNDSNNIKHTGLFVWQLTTEVLRLGIRRMHMAGYDIREAPDAWVVELGKYYRRSPFEPKNKPYYADYAFEYVDQCCNVANYSKLKRGKAEYAQFLDELRKADPEAFEQRK